MKNFTLIILIGFGSLVCGQIPTLPKALLKNWVSIPALDFKADGIEGNDSVNFTKTCHKVTTDEFFIYTREITNLEYREFVIETKNTAMWPDTNSWNTDFELAYNDPMRQYYFWHPKYADYPVVGISQIQAKAYCEWLQGILNEQLVKSEEYKNYTCLVSLPTDKQWESAFYYSYLQSENPNWSVAWIIKKKLIMTKKKYNVNYGVDLTKEGQSLNDYISDGGMYPVRYNEYKPAKQGLYNLMGNVAEWTVSPAYNYTDSSKVFFKKDTRQIISYLKCNGHEFYDTAKSYDYYYYPYNLKPVYEKDGYIAVKGGSWCHTMFYLQPGVSLYCKPDEQHSYIGFRPVMTLVKKGD